MQRRKKEGRGGGKKEERKNIYTLSFIDKGGCVHK